MEDFARKFNRALRGIFGKEQSLLIFDETSEGPRAALRASFILYEYWQMLFVYEEGIFGFEIPFRSSSAVVLLGPTAEWSLDDLDGLLRELDRRVRLRIPDKYLAAREVEGLRA